MFYDEISKDSKLRNISVGQKLSLAAGIVVVVLASENIVINIINIIVMYAINIYLLRKKYRDFLKLLFIPLIFLIVSCVPIIISVNTLNYLKYVQIFDIKIGITTSSIRDTIFIFTNAYAIILTSYFLILNTGLDKLLEYMYKINVPSIIINLCALIYRFIFVLYERHLIIKKSLISRQGYTDYKTSLYSTVYLFFNIYYKSFIRISNIQSALDSRLYDKEINYSTSVNIFSYKMLFFTIFYLITLLMIEVN
ncbi:MAG: CbiQ family ECF transporter T component [Bacilli bacterium]